jgi:hypothetical protein
MGALMGNLRAETATSGYILLGLVDLDAILSWMKLANEGSFDKVVSF